MYLNAVGVTPTLFQTWESELRVKCEQGERKRAFKNGFLRGYRNCFGKVLNLEWDECPADFELLEQLVLARNRDQHPDSISTMRVNHTYKDRIERGQLFFISETESRMFNDASLANISWMNPSVHVSQELLVRAIGEVEALAEWFEQHAITAR